MTLSLKLAQVTIEKASDGDYFLLEFHNSPCDSGNVIEIDAGDAIKMAKWILDHEGYQLHRRVNE